MKSSELEEISETLSNKTGLTVVFWYTLPATWDLMEELLDEDSIEEKDKTYHVMFRDMPYRDHCNVYFRLKGTWERVYETTKQVLKLIGYEID